MRPEGVCVAAHPAGADAPHSTANERRRLRHDLLRRSATTGMIRFVLRWYSEKTGIAAAIL